MSFSRLTEERYIQAAEARDIDRGVFRTYLQALGIDVDEVPQPDPDADLLNRSVLTRLEGALHPTLYGILAFGVDPQRYPQTSRFWIDCVAYSGLDRAAPAALTGEAKGRVDEQVQRALGWIRSLGRIERYTGTLREDIPLVPEVVLREALVNAVAHRDHAITGSKSFLEVFSDRIEVTSPGTLPNHMTPESVRAGGNPRSRNELLTNYLLVRRLMEQRGRGWPIMKRRMREFNGTEPELFQDESGAFVRVTLRLGGGPDDRHG